MRNDKAIRRPCVGGKHKTSHAVFIQRTTQHGRFSSIGRSPGAGRDLHPYLLHPVYDGVPQETGAAGKALIIVGGEPLIHHI